MHLLAFSLYTNYLIGINYKNILINYLVKTSLSQKIKLKIVGIRDRKFIKYEPEKHFIRAYALSKNNDNIWDLFPPVKGYHPFNTKRKRSYTVSQKRQHSDWAKLILQRDNKKSEQGPPPCG